MPRKFNDSATILLRGLKRLDPLPCANITIAEALAGTRRSPARPKGPIVTLRSTEFCPGSCVAVVTGILAAPS